MSEYFEENLRWNLMFTVCHSRSHSLLEDYNLYVLGWIFKNRAIPQSPVHFSSLLPTSFSAPFPSSTCCIEAPHIPFPVCPAVWLLVQLLPSRSSQPCPREWTQAHEDVPSLLLGEPSPCFAGGPKAMGCFFPSSPDRPFLCHGPVSPMIWESGASR